MKTELTLFTVMKEIRELRREVQELKDVLTVRNFPHYHATEFQNPLRPWPSTDDHFNGPACSVQTELPLRGGEDYTSPQ